MCVLVIVYLDVYMYENMCTFVILYPYMYAFVCGY